MHARAEMQYQQILMLPMLDDSLCYYGQSGESLQHDDLGRLWYQLMY